MIPGGVLAVIGASDCERLGTGLIAQPFNTWTSVAYLLAGGWIIARRRRWGLDPSAVVFGALVAANGVGSIGDWSRGPVPILNFIASLPYSSLINRRDAS